MKIQFCGAAGTVTGSCFLVKTEESTFLVDCGMFQGSKELKERNYGEFFFKPEDIDFVLLTHVHIDHSGLIPKLYKKGFEGPVYTTKATKELSAVVLPDSGHIQEMEVERKNRKLIRSGKETLEPIYTVEDAQKCLEFIQGNSYDEILQITPQIRVRFRDAGHILGSAMVEVFITEAGKEEKFVFTGDIGNINQPIIDDPTKLKEADFLVMESTYGNRYHIEADDKVKYLANIVKKTFKKGGNLVIPSFAVERAQDLIYDLKILREQGEIPNMDIYLDSPMAVEATKVFINNPECFDEEALIRIKGESAGVLFEDPKIHFVTTAEESMALNRVKGGAIIISASGMADAGRIKHHLKHNLWRPESTVLFVGYQAQGTLGRRILEGEKKVKIHGEEVAVKAEIAKIDGFSAHADQKGLVDWVKDFERKPRKIFLVHGEEEALDTLKRVLNNETGLDITVAQYGAEYDFSRDEAYIPESVAVQSKVQAEPNLISAFNIVKDRIQTLSQVPDSDVRNLQRLLAQVNEIEREIN